MLLIASHKKEITFVTSSNHALPNAGVLLGTRAGGAAGVRLRCSDPLLRAQLNRPWIRQIIEEQIDQSLEPAPVGASAVYAPVELLARHAFFAGATGSGKTRVSHALLRQQLQDGCNAVVLCGKPEDFRAALAICQGAGFRPEDIFAVDPAHDRYPGWNPLTAEPPQSAVRNVLQVFEAEAAGSWGDRMEDIFRNALCLIAEHGLSLWELLRFLTWKPYREAILRLPIRWEESEEALESFQNEYGGLSDAKWNEFVRPITNKVREVASNPFLRGVLCADRNTFCLSRLWGERRTALVVYLDEEAMGRKGTQLFSGILVNLMFRQALSAPLEQVKRPIVLSVDEVGFLGKFLGEPLRQMGGRGRGRFRLLVACQFLAQIEPALRQTLTSQCQVQGYFKLGDQDAAVAAAALADRTEGRVTGVRVEPGEWEWRRVLVTDAYGRALTVSPEVWAVTQQLWLSGGGAIRALRLLGRKTGAGRLYIGSQEVGTALKGVTATDIAPGGRHPLSVKIQMLVPRIGKIDRETLADLRRLWSKTLTELGKRQCVVTLEGKIVGVVKTADLPDQRLEDGAMEAIHGANSLTVEETRGLRNRRKAAASARAGLWQEPDGTDETKKTPPVPEVYADGSLS